MNGSAYHNPDFYSSAAAPSLTSFACIQAGEAVQSVHTKLQAAADNPSARTWVLPSSIRSKQGLERLISRQY